MRIISNNKEANHLAEISQVIDISNEAIICVAFLKMSGLKLILDKLNRIKENTTFFVGIDFYQTEPKALRKAYSEGYKLYIYTGKKREVTFHPKIFYFKNGEKTYTFIGSSNLTSGGLLTNIETSITIENIADSKFDLELKILIDNIKENSKLVNKQEIIGDYERRYLIYKEKHKFADDQFNIEEKLIVEEEKKRAEERKRKKKEGGEGTTTPKRLTITDEYKANWPLKFEEFKKYKKKNNGNPIVYKKHELHPWYRKQKDLYNAKDENGKRLIPTEHFDALDKEGFIWENGHEYRRLQTWEDNLTKAIEYSFLKKQSYVWVVWEHKDPKFKYKTQAHWCIRQRQRINGLHKPMSTYELKRLREVKFLFDSENEGGKLKEDDFIEGLIKISEYKTKRLNEGNFNWLPSQTDNDPEIAELGNWLNDKLEWLKAHLKNGTQIDVAKQREKDFLELGIYTEGIRKSYFEFFAKHYLEMRKLYPIDNPTGEERVPFAHILKWETENRSRFDTFPEWRQKRLKELGIVK